MTQAQDKLKIGLERLRKAENDHDLLGLALTSIHGALEDHFRDLLKSSSKVPSQQRTRVQEHQQVQWKELVDLMQQYHGLSNDEKKRILDMNKLRQGIAHGGQFTGTRSELERYAEYVRGCIEDFSSVHAGANNWQPSSKSSYNPSTNSRAYSFSDRVRTQYYKFGLLPQWMIANFCGTFVGWIAPSILCGIAISLNVISKDSSPFLIVISLFLALGVAQQTVVSRLFHKLSGWWAVSTVAGGLMASIFMMIINSHNQTIMAVINNPVSVALVGAVVGLNLGFFQFLILKQQTKKANLWLIASAGQGVLFCVICLILTSTFGQKNGFVNFLIPLFLLPSLCSAITGIVLINLFPYNRSHVK